MLFYRSYHQKFWTGVQETTPSRHKEGKLNPPRTLTTETRWCILFVVKHENLRLSFFHYVEEGPKEKPFERNLLRSVVLHSEYVSP